MGFTAKNGAIAASAADTCNVTLTGTAVSAGDLIVCWCGWQVDGLTRSVSDGASGFIGAGTNTGGAWATSNGEFIYCLSSVATGLPTYTFTATGSVVPCMHLWVFTPTATPVMDQQIYTASTGTPGSSSVDTGSITTTGTDELVLGGLFANGDTTPVTSPAIGGGAADNSFFGYEIGSFTIGSWFRAITGTVNATATLNLSANWLANAISFKIPGVATSIYTSSSGIPVRGAARTRVIYG